MGIGKYIKEFRVKNRMTQSDFGQIVGVNKQTVSKWENETMQPSTQKIFEIIQALGISVSSAFKDELQLDIDAPYIYTHRTVYDIGLNSLYHSVCDFATFGVFVDAIESVNKLLDFDIVGYLRINMTFEQEDSYKNAIPIKSIFFDEDSLIIDLLDDTLKITNEKVSNMKCVGSFNNECYIFDMYLSEQYNKQPMFFQLLFDMNNTNTSK